ncbi:SDR family oxidoreductase [Rhodococcus sp. 06-462-5]|uniref:SDR family NAD(P)-dependent oxidoreductase n=1 Tax=Nocardiaceae TaxID=85025 RepID=UPI00050C94B4|nr:MULTISPECIES: SDR family NAD(P)-dependent oxidoreductase [Rhodococcus]OZC73962.1 SDR family oxidoreductase [Rhodococcus sp. 06-462-5]OZE67958.1 SDR family oxidoreductase [Rhodococcus sp. 02-925g]OZF52021.1 SDR family oxidoreductase [Rhodococcus sp. 14-1411-2a]
MTNSPDKTPTAVLIGVTGGFGHPLAKLLANEGYRLVLAARRESDAAALTGRSDGSAIYVRADVADPASLKELAAAAFEHLGRIDAVVNLAGISPRKAIGEYTQTDVDSMLEVNVKGPIFVTQAFLPGLLEQAGGSVIVHVGGAMDGRVGLPFMSAYAASRGALAGYVQASNRELDGTGVALSFFGPAPANTESESAYFDMWHEMGVDLVEPETVAGEILTTIRKRRQQHVMGGLMLRMMSAVNAVSPSAADVIGLRKFGKLMTQYHPR